MFEMTWKSSTCNWPDYREDQLLLSYRIASMYRCRMFTLQSQLWTNSHSTPYWVRNDWQLSLLTEVVYLSFKHCFAFISITKKVIKPQKRWKKAFENKKLLKGVCCLSHWCSAKTEMGNALSEK